MNLAIAPAGVRNRAMGPLLSAALALASPPVTGAEADICQGKTGADLVRCIEQAARAKPGDTATPLAPSAPAGAAPAGRERVPAPATHDATGPAPEDCTGRAGTELRRCLAAGGRLAPSAATVSVQPAPARTTEGESCEAKSGEALRTCIEAAAKSAKPAAAAAAEPKTIGCTGYTPADQPLCVHRNSVIVQCRNRQLYPDYDVCLRSYMIRAPDPVRADCGKLPARARAHCDARNQVFQACLGDKLGYFACLEHRLGADAVITRR
ncbi:MAG: hypothetical protein IT531_24560 [Burkholderiales bacterium]|nr:hypothetical protein [Burkholderiales bacterium]